MRQHLRAIVAIAALCSPAVAATTDAPQPDTVRIAAALDLPRVAHDLRKRGVVDAEVGKALHAARDKGLRSDEAKEALEASAEAIDEHGHIDNFGDFVKSQLAEGLRGRELAAAIRAEHAANGKGKGHAKKPGDGAGHAKGADKSGEHKRPADAGDKHGKPKRRATATVMATAMTTTVGAQSAASPRRPIGRSADQLAPREAGNEPPRTDLVPRGLQRRDCPPPPILPPPKHRLTRRSPTRWPEHLRSRTPTTR